MGEIREHRGLEGFGSDEAALGRAKEKHSGFSTVPSFIPFHKLQSELPGRCVLRSRDSQWSQT